MKGKCFDDQRLSLVQDGTVTQFRELVKPQPQEGVTGIYPGYDGDTYWREHRLNAGYGKTGYTMLPAHRPRFVPGEVVYVKEPWCGGQHGMSVQYRDDWTPHDYGPSWRSAASMPASSARTFLRILDVRAERLQEISEEDAMREGSVAQFSSVHGLPRLDGYGLRCVGLKPIPMQGFMALWDSLAKPGERWDDKPWVWVYTYELTEAP